MRIALYILLLLSSGTFACAQSKKFEFQDVCGDPRMESMAWVPLTGKAAEIVDGATFLLRQSDGRTKTVELAAIDASANPAAAKDFLTKTLLGREIEVLVNPSRSRDEKIAGEVHLKDREINRELIERGLARFREPAPYSFSNYSACVYQKLEEKARVAKLGIWER